MRGNASHEQPRVCARDLFPARMRERLRRSQCEVRFMCMIHSTRIRHIIRSAHCRSNGCPESCSRPPIVALCPHCGIAPINRPVSVRRQSPVCQANSRHYNSLRGNAIHKQPSPCARELFPAALRERLNAVTYHSHVHGYDSK